MSTNGDFKKMLYYYGLSRHKFIVRFAPKQLVIDLNLALEG